MSRGVLLDVAEWLGTEALEAGYAIGPEALDAAAAAHGVEPEPGDVVLVRTGYGSVRGDHRRRVPDVALAPGSSDRSTLPHLPGLAESTLPWFRTHDIAIVGTDTGTERRPSTQQWIAPFHVVAMCAMGMWVLNLRAGGARPDLPPVVALDVHDLSSPRFVSKTRLGRR